MAEPPNTPPAANTPSTLQGQHRLHSGKGHFERSPETVERDAQAAALRAERWTYQAIADHLGYTDRTGARRGVERARADVARPAITKLIQDESDELDELYALALEVIHANHVVVSHGKVVTMRDPETGEEKPLTDNGPKLQAIQTALRIRDQYQNLYGLKQPAKLEHSGGVKYELVGVDPQDVV